MVIHEPAYHATLDPALKRVQMLIENIEFSSSGDIQTCYFQMRDAQGDYGLAAGFRYGRLYFQAVKTSDQDALREFSEQVMADIPFKPSACSDDGLIAAVKLAAEQQRAILH